MQISIRPYRITYLTKNINELSQKIINMLFDQNTIMLSSEKENKKPLDWTIGSLDRCLDRFMTDLHCGASVWLAYTWRRVVTYFSLPERGK